MFTDNLPFAKSKAAAEEGCFASDAEVRQIYRSPQALQQ